MATQKFSRENALEEQEEQDVFYAIDEMDLKKSTHDKYRAVIIMMMRGGLRVTEAVHAREEWLKKIELENDNYIELSIPASDVDINHLKSRKKSPPLWKPKTKAGARDIIFTNKEDGLEIYHFLRNYHHIGLTRIRVYQIIRRIGRMIGKPNLHPHSLRSTFANRVLEMGADEITLMHYMGWSDIRTARSYIKSSKSYARKKLIDLAKQKNTGK